ncbi:Ribosomal protein L20 [Ignavibacterium album JCM 16511]|jgi:large subunit ribosomal protein L20|uniref:Large ribosomal subunit protein bL20 n=1 Tax=Ignavibacterium album (strain DSM 19864 / JCM 16511 / NBRC 101810 / Mat9-16) TaxID=945713 RepID=I0AJJ1_IGNAJ|nr:MULTISPECIES: 50S ribosomal protein L20 [Ignavibacterium]AFH49148.1 Ribosomal protein L20 [Ignavibacterium album JCM 16511]MBI5663342.1 50S ribosomal protein L20 [Ignavibacterium album]MCL6493381.1 50S ribosomal protein L20 [Ignavibacterium sp.]MCX8106572.1 50S ribosomal protein L20 [Ignavibacterium album]
MPRSKNKVASHRRRKKILSLAKGYWGARGNVYTIAKNSVEKGLLHAYRDRKLKKRSFRQLWITRINAAARMNGTTYSRLIDALNKKGVEINRKVLASLALENPNAFTELVKFTQN